MCTFGLTVCMWEGLVRWGGAQTWKGGKRAVLDQRKADLLPWRHQSVLLARNHMRLLIYAKRARACAILLVPGDCYTRYQCDFYQSSEYFCLDSHRIIWNWIQIQRKISWHRRFLLYVLTIWLEWDMQMKNIIGYWLLCRLYQFHVTQIITLQRKWQNWSSKRSSLIYIDCLTSLWLRQTIQSGADVPWQGVPVVKHRVSCGFCATLYILSN